MYGQCYFSNYAWTVKKGSFHPLQMQLSGVLIHLFMDGEPLSGIPFQLLAECGH